MSPARKSTKTRRPAPRSARKASPTVPPAAPLPEAAPGPGEQGEVPELPSRGAFPVVGVGASAGGLEAFRQLLGALPVATGMAYVFVQHLDARHDSILAALLSKGSQMPVLEVKQDTVIEADHVYVTPGHHDLSLEGELLKLVPRATTAGRHLPVDSFLRSLAEARGHQGISVILSGTGSDGTLGARAIKAGGGIAFAQEPASAAYDGMPRSAIASGCVDFVLPPERIAQELMRLSRHPYVIAVPREERPDGAPLAAPKGKDAFVEILTLLRRATGSDFSTYKAATIKRRMGRRMALVHVDTLHEYARYLAVHADEAHALYQDCLITVTSFFRDPDTYQALEREVLSRLVRDRAPGGPLRVWVPGCATGEEAYSIVISLVERAAELKVDLSLQVFGTDLSESALEKARIGRYPPSIAADVSPARMQRFFTEVAGGYQVSKAIRETCVFARQDVTRDPPFGRMDLISCRNLLIYLEPRMQQRVLSLFHYALSVPGFLVLGASETVSTSADLFTAVDQKQRIYLKRPAAAPLILGFGRPRGEGGDEQGSPVTRPALREELPREADRILLARYAPVSVIVDDKDNIVEFRGETEPYLEHAHGRASLNLFKMARKGLLLDVRQAVEDARKQDAPVRKEGMSLRQRDQVRRVDVEVVPLRGSPRPGRSLLVLFEARPEARSPRAARAEPPPRAEGPQVRENARLRRELAEATRYLEAVTQQHEAASEELQASNEEVLSANEELQSINEELETAKEELQASNEELATLNQELQGRNLQLERALDYANGIVETVRNPLLILDASLRVERANRTFYDYFRVDPEETMGRLVYELGERQWDIPALRRSLDQILGQTARLEDVEVEHEFPRIGRRTLLVNVRKLRRESEHDSILLAFEDRTAARDTEKQREALLGLEQQARQRAEQADRIKDEFMATLSHELRGPLTAMVGWVHLLRAPGTDEATRERGRAAIERNVKTQARLIEDLLDFSRVISGKLHLVRQGVDLVPLVGAAVESVRSAAEAKGVGLQIQTDAEPATVLGDPDRLQQILWNLLSNAVKFTPAGGRVDVWVGRQESSLLIRVTDTGQGISRDFLPHVFERFRQQDGTSQRQHGGLGLGMAIVKELVELHGGTVRADSLGPGQGATFTVALPVPVLLLPSGVGDPEAPESPRPEVAWTRTALQGMRLLVVEDEPDSREMLTTAFEQCGAAVSAASSAREATEILLVTPPDVLVCDIGLPGEDGHQLMRRIRAREAEQGGRIPALALTAYSGAPENAKALAAGFDMQVAKPVAPAELVARVALLAGSRGRT